jgi:hypothetical protein
MATGHDYLQSESPGEANAREADFAYFAEHPEETCYVRRVIDGEADSAHDDTQAEWASVEWVLVTLVGDRRDRRERSPLHPMGSVLVDGAVRPRP